MDGDYFSDHYETFKIMLIVRIILTALVVIPAVFFFVKLLGTPGYNQDTTRRWVTYTTAGFGLWALEHLILIVLWGVQTVSVKIELGWTGATYRVADAIFSVFLYIESFLVIWGQVSIFLALFYMAHALTLLRTGSEPDSTAYRKGRGFALGGSIFVALISFVFFCLYLSVAFSSQGYNNSGWAMRNLMAQIFQLTSQAILIAMAIGSVVYSAKSRKKALGTAVERAGTMLVWCSSLFLVREIWELFSFFFGARVLYFFWFPTFWVDLLFGSYLSFAILVLLYVVATKATYAMSKTQYRLKVESEEVEA